MANNKKKASIPQYSEEDILILKKNKRRKIIYILLSCLLSLIVLFFSIGQIGCAYAQKSLHFWRPNYDKIEISSLLEKEILTEEEYEILYRQTGLTKLGIEDMRYDEKGRKRILEIQENLFKEYKTKTYNFGLFTYTEELTYNGDEGFSSLAKLQDGDILVSSSMYCSWWRLGHCALVIDGQAGLMLEAIKPGRGSEISSVNDFNCRANFILLRPNVDEEIKAQVVEYARQNLVGVKYALTTGIFNKKFSKNIQTSHCGHIVWYPYQKFGIDIDYNGGAVVLPEDIYRSEYMQVVQVFGLDLDKLWQ